jgi:hypothetical protein
MYLERLRRNIRPVIEDHGFQLISNTKVLKSISGRHIHNVVKGDADITVGMLEAVADEIGADMMDFFKK